MKTVALLLAIGPLILNKILNIYKVAARLIIYGKYQFSRLVMEMVVWAPTLREMSSDF